MIQWMLAIWSLVPLPFLNPAWTSGSSRFMYYWSLAWRILSITLLPAAGLLWVQPALKLKSQSENESRSVISNSLWLQGLHNSPSQNTGVGSLSLLQGIILTQGLNPGLLHCRQILYHLSHKGSPFPNPLSGYLISAGCSENNKTHFPPLRLLWAQAEVGGEIGDSKFWIWRCSKMPWKAKKGKVKVKSLSRVQLFAIPWTVTYQAPPSMGFSRQEH